MTQTPEHRPKAGLFVTCLVDLIRPSVGFAAATLIERAGCDVIVPQGQTCCGQPAYNSGDRANAQALALQTVNAFIDCDYVVVPSGSCASMLKVHVPDLLADGPDREAALTRSARGDSGAQQLAARAQLAEAQAALAKSRITANFRASIPEHG